MWDVLFSFWDMRCFINIGLGDKCEKGFGKISNKYKKGEKYIWEENVQEQAVEIARKKRDGTDEKFNYVA